MPVGQNLIDGGSKGMVHGRMQCSGGSMVADKQGCVAGCVCSFDHTQRTRGSPHDLHVLWKPVEQQVLHMAVTVGDHDCSFLVHTPDAFDGGTRLARDEFSLLLNTF